MSLSVPSYSRRPPRPLDRIEQDTFLAVADALIPAGDGGPQPSSVEKYAEWSERALAARADVFDDVIGALDRLRDIRGDALAAALRDANETETGIWALMSVAAGAYLMVPAVRRQLGYPGQLPNPAPFDEAAEQIMDGILDPVLERGRIFTPTEDASRHAEKR